MSEGAGSAAEQSQSAGSTSQRSSAVQATWLVILGRKGVAFITNNQSEAVAAKAEYTRLAMVTRDALIDLLNAVGGGSSDQTRATPSLALESLLAVIVDQCHAFNLLDRELESETAWISPIESLFVKVLQDSPVFVSRNPRATAAGLLRIIGHTDLRKAKPDMIIGLRPNEIRIAENSTSDPIRRDIQDYIISRSMQVPYELSQYIKSQQYYPFLFFELKGALGSAGEARIQNTTACFIGLQILRSLAHLARNEDSQSFRAPTDTMRRVYGLQTVGTGELWRLVVMKACQEYYDINPEDDPAGSTYSIITLWSGDVTEPTKLIELVAIIEAIGAEAAERAEIIGNWLYCLRDAEAVKTPRKRATVPSAAIASGQVDKSASPSKRARQGKTRRSAPDANTVGQSSHEAPPADDTDINLVIEYKRTTGRARAKMFELGLAPLRNSAPMSKPSIDAWVSDVASSFGSSPSPDRKVYELSSNVDDVVTSLGLS